MLNTVGYYSIPQSAVLALQPRHPGTFTYRSESNYITLYNYV